MNDNFDWWATAGLALAPLLLLGLMPKSRVRELWLRGYLGVLLIAAGLGGCLSLLLPLVLPPESRFFAWLAFFFASVGVAADAVGGLGAAVAQKQAENDAGQRFAVAGGGGGFGVGGDWGGVACDADRAVFADYVYLLGEGVAAF